MGSLLSRCNCWRKCVSNSGDPAFSSVLAVNVNDSSENPDSPYEPKKYSWDKKPRLDPQNYTFSNLNEEQSVKLPGEINGQQFIIKNCVNSKIYLFDYASTVTIDDCSDCIIVLGPVQSSIFMRDTKNSTLVCASSQLRLRDCQNIHLFVGCESDPIIEASSEIIVGPYFLYYKGIEDHFKAAKLSRFKAVHWSEIYDFTPNDSSPNWRQYDRNKHHPKKYICPPEPLEMFSGLEISVSNRLQSFIPVTYNLESDANPNATESLLGNKPWRIQDVTFTLENGQELNVLEDFMNKFYREKFLCESNGEPIAILDNIQSINRNQFTFTYYSLLHG